MIRYANIGGLTIALGLVLIPGIAASAELDFYRDIYPFLKTNCVSCHKKTTTKAGLNMETPELMIKGGDSGPAIIPGKGSESLLVEASEHSDFIEMPPSKNKTGARPLNGAELAKLIQWIDEGAKSSRQEVRKVKWQALSSQVDPIYSISMTKDGRYVSCGRGNRIFVYDLATRQLVDEAKAPNGTAHRALVNSLAFSPDGTRLASGSFRELKIWKKIQTPAETRKADPSKGMIATAPTPDGKQLVALDKTGNLLRLEAKSGKVMGKIESAASGGAHLLAVSPDGTRVAILSTPWSLSVLDLVNGKLLGKQSIFDPKLEARAREALANATVAEKGLIAARKALSKAVDAKKKAEAALSKQTAQAGSDPNGKILNAVAAATKAEVEARRQLTAAEKAAASKKKSATDLATASKRAQATAPGALGWSADGTSLLAAAADHQIRVYSIPDSGESFSAPKIWKGANGIHSIAAAPGGQIVTGGSDNKVRIWNLSDGKIIREFSAATINVAVSPDGKHVATGSDDGRVRLWDAAKGEQLFDLRGTPAQLAKLAELEMTSDRDKLEQTFQKARATAIAARDKGLVDLLKKAKDAVVAMNKKIPEAKKAIPPAKEARVAAAKKVAEAEAALKNPPEGKTPATLESDLKKAKVALLAAETKENDAIAALAAFESNVIDAQASQKDITAQQAANKKEIAEANAIESEAKNRISKTNTALVLARKKAAAVGPKPLALAFSSDSSRIASKGADGSIRVWAVVSGTPVEATTGNPPAEIGSLVATDDGAFLSAHPDGTVSTTASSPVWQIERILGGDKAPELFADRVESVSFSPDGKTLAAGDGEPSRSGNITLFEVASGKVTASWKDCHADSVISLAFSPNGKQIATGSADKIARVIDIESGEQVNIFEGHTHYVNDVAFRSDSRVLATAGGDGVVNSWDLAKGERIKKIEGWTKEVTSLEFVGATNQIVTSAGDNKVRIITDAGSQIRAISDLPDFMQTAASSPDGKLIVAGGEDSYLRVWNGKDGKEIIAFGMQ